MNKLNPLYIVALFFTVLLISFFYLDMKRSDYTLKVKKLELLKNSSKQYVEYKSNWDNRKFVENTINKILKSRSFRNQKVLKASTARVLKVKIESKDKKVLNEFLNKVLNKKLLIKKLRLEKDFISLEIGLKI